MGLPRIYNSDCCGEGACAPAGETPADCGDLCDCLHSMFAALRFEFDDDGDCQWSALNGTYFFTDLAGGCSEGTDAFWRSDGVSLVLSALWAAARGDCANSTCLDDSGPGFSFFGITANCSPEGFQIEFGAACDDDTTTDPTGSLLLTIPTEVTHGVEFEFDSVSVPGTAFISFWGKPCTGPDTCGDGPETDFSSSGAGCTKTITPTDTPGRCPILWWFDNLGNTGTTSAAYSVTIPGECGDLSFDYTRWVIDEAGCIASATHTLTCCECESCPPEGSVTISQYAPQPDGFPIIMDDDGDLNSSPDYDGDNCGPDGGLTCHYIYLDRVDFGSITTAGCSGMTAKYYITSWGGALDADGDPLPTFTDNPPLGQYDAGDHQDFRMDEGYLGEAYCIEGYIEDSSGCRTYFAIPTGHDMAAGFPDEPRFHPTCETP